MVIVVVTAEPRGAYHLTPLGAVIAQSAVSFTHLVPYPEPVQGVAVMPVTSDVSVLESCDRLVVTGGGLSAWTELVVRRAVTLGKPIIFSELAHVSGSGPFDIGSHVVAATALSNVGARAVRHYFGVDQVLVTGTPALDSLPSWCPIPRQVLLLSTSDMAERDPDRMLVTIGSTLVAAGWDVRVRLHPREDRGPWAGFSVVEGETVTESVASAAVAVGYPGSAHVVAAAVGAPVVSVAPTDELRGVLTGQQLAVLAAQTTTVPDTLACIEHVVPAARAAVVDVVGPIGGAAARMLDVWTGPLTAPGPDLHRS